MTQLPYTLYFDKAFQRFSLSYLPFDVFVQKAILRVRRLFQILQQQTKSRMKCLVFLAAVALLVVMVGSNTTTIIAATSSSAVASASASQAANVNTTTTATPEPTTEPATTESLGVNVLPSAFMMSVAFLVAALQ